MQSQAFTADGDQEKKPLQNLLLDIRLKTFWSCPVKGIDYMVESPGNYPALFISSSYQKLWLECCSLCLFYVRNFWKMSKY